MAMTHIPTSTHQVNNGHDTHPNLYSPGQQWSLHTSQPLFTKSTMAMRHDAHPNLYSPGQQWPLHPFQPGPPMALNCLPGAVGRVYDPPRGCPGDEQCRQRRLTLLSPEPQGKGNKSVIQTDTRREDSRTKGLL